ncbi:MAG: amidohydrolase [Oscillospiraceae bacterium]|nr:amidohydrolase [Oscillospiraceae bacterium]
MQKIDLMVRSAKILEPGHSDLPERSKGIAIDRGVILAVGEEQDLLAQYDPARILDASGMYVCPGFVNTHDHLFQVLTKGLGKERLLWDWLENTIRQMTPYIDEEAIYYAALAGCMESIHSGITTTLDFQYCHSHIGQFDAVCQAFRDCGIRGYVGRIQYKGDYLGLSKVPPETPEEYFRNVSNIHSQMEDPARLDVALIAPGIPGILDEPDYQNGYLREIRECAETLNVPYTQHLVETVDDDEYLVAKCGERSVPYLEKQSFFGPRCVLAHCVKMHPEDFAIFQRYDVKVSHNPVSNMILASGISPVRTFLDHGICVSLGVDGAGSNDSQDMLETIKIANLLQKVNALDARVLTASETLEIACKGGARALCRDDIGELVPGKRADFFFYNPRTLKSAPVADPISSLVYASGEENIHTVVINGKIVLENGRFTTANEEHVIEMLERCAYHIRKCSNLPDRV